MSRASSLPQFPTDLTGFADPDGGFRRRKGADRLKIETRPIRSDLASDLTPAPPVLHFQGPAFHS
jgi:hypothetical protein